MSEQTEQGVVDLVDAGVPADHGLSSLGLLMQLGGNVLAAYASLVAFITIFLPGGGEKLWMFLLVAISVGRSLLHKSAGTQLLYGKPTLSVDGAGKPSTSGVYRYVGAALIHTVIFAGVLAAKFHLPSRLVVGIGLGLAAWPVTLVAMLSLPRFKRFRTELPLSQDKGFEAAAILMTVLGLCGAVGAGTFLLVLLDMPGKVLQQGPNVLIVLSLILLLARSVIHVQAGLSGLRETSVDRSVELANRYANFGVISSFCAGGALLLVVMTSITNVMGLALICGLVWMLMAWPMTIRRFFSDRQFADLMAGDQAPIHHRSPDAGLTGLGWLLIAHAVFSASFLLPEILMAHGHGGGDFRELMALGGAAGMRSLWWSVGVVGLQSWAGFELIRMSPQSRTISTIFGAVGVAVTLYVSWPLIHAMSHMHGMHNMSQAMSFGPLALQLIIPIATIVLVNRKITPTARARFRSRPTETPPA